MPTFLHLQTYGIHVECKKYSTVSFYLVLLRFSWYINEAQKGSRDCVIGMEDSGKVAPK